MSLRFKLQATSRTSGAEGCVILRRSLQPEAWSGFTLIELVISMAILGVGLVGAMRVFPMGLRASQRAEIVSRSTITGQRVIESLKLQSWEALVEGTTKTQDGDFEVATTISQPSVEHLEDISRLKAVEVSVRSLQSDRSHAVTFVTYLRRNTS